MLYEKLREELWGTGQVLICPQYENLMPLLTLYALIIIRLSMAIRPKEFIDCILYECKLLLRAQMVENIQISQFLWAYSMKEKHANAFQILDYDCTLHSSSFLSQIISIVEGPRINAGYCTNCHFKHVELWPIKRQVPHQFRLSSRE
jgi:hypothetical protein